MTKPLELKPFVPAFVWALVILALSTTAGIQMPEMIWSPDKLGHVAAYGILTWLVFRALRKTGKYSNQSAFWIILLVGIYGAALEFVQWAFFPYRFFEVWDMAANFGGALMYFIFDRIFTTQN